MSYYWFNREEVLHKAKKKHKNCSGKEKAAEYYKTNKDAIKERAKNRYKNLSEQEKDAKESIQKPGIKK